MHNHMTAHQLGRLYILVAQHGLNGMRGIISFREGVAGPVSGEMARQACAMGGIKSFEYDPAKRIDWYPHGGIIEAFYEIDAGHEKLAADFKAQAEHAKAKDAEEQANRDAATKRDAFEARRAEALGAAATLKAFEVDYGVPDHPAPPPATPVKEEEPALPPTPAPNPKAKAAPKKKAAKKKVKK